MKTHLTPLVPRPLDGLGSVLVLLTTQGRYAKALKRPLTLPEASNWLYRRTGLRPFLTLSRGVIEAQFLGGESYLHERRATS